MNRGGGRGFRGGGYRGHARSRGGGGGGGGGGGRVHQIPRPFPLPFWNPWEGLERLQGVPPAVLPLQRSAALAAPSAAAELQGDEPSEEEGQGM